ncbi:Importin alpha subunit (Karyopherin alpha subunit) (Serine-rich RNA polymerase I suppressor protein) [Tulasnella sp. UAMH 9824]|nr:Importin alpha subunit (Karyopherin alpha subunit) (Serine-rich RNA polymerase I suppressor protein) [Tulasnella sp. UAMH 9824]
MYWAANALQSITYSPKPGSAGYDVVWDIIPVLTKYIEYQKKETPKSLEASLWALSYILSVESTIEAVSHTHIVPRLVQLCTATHAPTRRPSLRRVGSIIASSKGGTDQLVDAGVIEAIKPCITSEDRQQRKDACWAAANIAVGTLEPAKALLADGLIPPLVKVASDPEEGAQG